MEMTEHYANIEPSRADVDALEGPVLLEFGTARCGHCRAAQPLIGKALADRSGITHLKIEDGPGRPLGRSFRVKLWPTLILLSRAGAGTRGSPAGLAGHRAGHGCSRTRLNRVQPRGHGPGNTGIDPVLRDHRQASRGIIRRPVLQEPWRVAHVRTRSAVVPIRNQSL